MSEGGSLDKRGRAGKSLNPLNQFLFDKINEIKRSAESRNQTKIAFCYSKILRALQRYPIPILSASQALCLDGVGQKLAALIGNLVRENYADHIDPNAEKSAFIEFDEKKKSKKEKESKSKVKPFSLNSYFTAVQSQEKELNDVENKKKDLNIMNEAEDESSKAKHAIRDFTLISENFSKKLNQEIKKKPLGKVIEIDDSDVRVKRLKESANAGGKNLPEEKTNPWAILLGLHYSMNSLKRQFSTKKEIKESFLKFAKEYEIDFHITHWEPMKTLIRKEYVSYDSENEKFTLTSLGEDIAQKLCKNYRKTTISFENENEQVVMKGVEVVPKDETNEEIIEPKITIFSKEIESYKLWLYIDNREVKAANERSFFHTKLAENGIPCLLHNLPIGDFLWVLEMKGKSIYSVKGKNDPLLLILDYIIERKTVDDLASSIVDGRYNHQKYRLLLCGVENIFYLVEGQVPRGGHISTALNTTRLFHGFNITHTDSINDSIRRLTLMTVSIQKLIDQTIKTKETIQFPSTFQGFMAKNVRNHTNVNIIIKVREIFGNMLRNVKGFGAESVSTILSIYQTPLSLFEKLMSFPSIEQATDAFSSSKLKKKKDKGLLTRNNAKTLSILFTQNPFPPQI